MPVVCFYFYQEAAINLTVGEALFLQQTAINAVIL